MRIDSTARKVLIYRLGSLGDTVVALPCYHLIARVFPNAERRLLTNFPVHAKAPAAAAVLGQSGLVHGYMRYTAGTRNAVELLRLVWEIRRFRPDFLVYLMPVRPLKDVRRDQRFFRISGVRRIVGLPAEEELKHRLDPATGFYEREACRLARTISALGDADTGNPDNWSLCLTEAERYTAIASLGALARGPFIVCGPGTKMQAKDWGQDNWRALIAYLSTEYPEHALVMVGAKEEASMSDIAAQEWVGPKVNLCGRLSPRETAAVMEQAQVFLGPDSGPMHLAASVGTPCVIAFSAAGIPGVWFPAGQRHQIVYHQTSCYGCRLQTCIAEARRCLTSITVAEMASAVARILGSPDKKRALDILHGGWINPAHKAGSP